jgi:deoxyribodipyrimidine photo-lyase
MFRRDLRIEDNDALTYSIKNGDTVSPIFILDPYFKNSELNGPMRYRFLLESLIDLDKQLQTIDLRLTVYVGDTVEVLKSLLSSEVGLTYNYDIQVEYGRVRDSAINTFCDQDNIELYIGNNQYVKVEDFVFDKWFGEHDHYQQAEMFTPHLSNQMPITSGFEILTPYELDKYISLLPKSSIYTGGSSNANMALDEFLNKDFDNYYWQLSRPYLAQVGHTSHLSAHIAFGTISTRQVHQKVKSYLASKPNYKKKNMSGRAYLERLRWRDGFTNRLVFHPEIEWGNKFEEFDNHYNPSLTPKQSELLKLWKLGKSGYPLVDAAMRQLLVDGWMIFRLRAMCASFLCFHLGISWHHGAKHFMNYLVDGDIAINHWQWQMQAGATDPYNPIFRVYNPTKNIPSRDPQLQYIHYWVPESRKYTNIEQLLVAFPQIPEYEDNMKKNKDKINAIRKGIRNKYLGIEKAEIVEAVEIDRRIELF